MRQNVVDTNRSRAHRLVDLRILYPCKKWPHEQNFELGWRDVTPGAFSWQFQMTPYPSMMS